ncbi:MAG: ABC transporter permease [Thermodesulfobacteriota bacterium]
MNTLRIIRNLFASHALIRTMVAQEVASRYSGTLGGFAWAILNPVLNLMVFWFIFSVIFKPELEGAPFIIYYACGFIPWSMFAEAVMHSCTAITSKPFLIKKTVFPSEILPIVSMGASQVTHLTMLLLFLGIMVFQGVPFSWWNLQFLYYLGAMSLFILGLSWLMSAINVFYRDTSQILQHILNFWFWGTPIVWHVSMVPEPYRHLLRINPMAYIVQGYQNSFIYHVPFWSDVTSGLIFWGYTLAALAAGAHLFRKLKPEFEEAL